MGCWKESLGSVNQGLLLSHRVLRGMCYIKGPQDSHVHLQVMHVVYLCRDNILSHGLHLSFHIYQDQLPTMMYLFHMNII